MKRSGELKRKTPMKRSTFSRSGSPFGWPTRATALKRSEMKRLVKNPTVAEGSKYLAACRGEQCYLRVPGICIGAETVVPCHSNQQRHGKGMGRKAEHHYTVPGCSACHAWIDQGSAPREVKFERWDRAYEAWEPVRARKMGIEIGEAA